MAPPLADGLLSYAAHACGSSSSCRYFFKVFYLYYLYMYLMKLCGHA